MKPIILPYFDKKPIISEKAFIAPGSSIIGDVTIEEGSSVWFNSIIRGDVAQILIGKNTNIQDGSVIHVTRNGFNTFIGSNVTIGHKSLLHACTIEDASFIGMGAIIMDSVVVETGAWVAAGSLVTNNKVIRSGEIWAGNPAKFFRKLTDSEKEHIFISASNYKVHSEEYLNILSNLNN